MKTAGFEPVVHQQVSARHFIFPGTDEERAGAFFEYASEARIPVIWMARGGYGAQRILPLLDGLTRKRGKPEKKLLVGYSDVTVLHEYVRTRWGWSTLHAPMPAASSFPKLQPEEWRAIIDFINKKPAASPWERKPLT